MADGAIAAFMIMMGVGITVIWTRDIVTGTQFDHSRGRRHARDDDGSLLLPHWVAEYATAVGLLIGAAGLLADTGWAAVVTPAALGGLWYTSTNSLGWAMAQSDRRTYAIPMVIGLVGSTICLITLLATLG
jgi:hypothetical protein